MVRPLEFDREEVLESAMQVFWGHGYHASTLQDLLRETGLSKSSMYQSFGSKEQLFESCLDRYVDQMVGELEQSLEASPSGFAFIQSALAAIADEAGAGQTRWGCMLTNTANELGQGDQQLSPLIAHNMQRVATVFELAAHRGQREGDLDTAKDAADLGRYLAGSVSGLKTLVRSGESGENVRAAAHIAAAACQS